MTTASLNIRVDSSEVSKADRSLDDLAKSGANADKSATKLTGSTERLSSVARVAAGAFAALGASVSVREIIQASDAWQSAANQLRLVTNSASELSAVQSKLMGVSNDTRSSFESTANLYTRLTRATSEMGLSQSELIGITTTINQSFAVSGATAAEAAAAITQLSQGLAAGALRGDEFNSVAEQAPGIMRAIAESLNMTTGELRAFAAEGGVTAEIVVNALQGAADSIDQDFGKSVMTFGQSMQVAKNNMLEFVGTSETVTSATQTAGRAVMFLSENMDTLVMVAGAAATLMAARVASSIAAAGVSAVTATAGMASLSSAMALLGGPVGVAVLASVGVYKLVDAYMDHNEAAREVETAAFLAQNGIHLVGKEFEDVVAKIDAASQSLREYVEAGGALSGMIEKGRQEAAQRARDAIAARNATEASTGAIVENTVRTKEQIAELRKQAVALDHGAFSTAKKTEALNALIDSLSEVRLSYSENIAIMNEATWVMQGVTAATEDLADTSEDSNARMTESGQEAARTAAEAWGRTHDYMSGVFVDLMNNGGNAFDNIAKSFEQMVKRMVAEWAASKLMDVFGMKAPSGGGGGLGTIGSILGSIGKGGATQPGGVAATMGAGAKIGSTIASAGGAIGGAVSSAGSAIMSGISAIPGWGWAIGGAALLGSQLAKEETPSGNAGFLIRPVGGGDGRTFDVPAFSSGFDPVGFARREDQGAAIAVIDTFRQYDAALTQIANAAGLNVSYNSNNFGGFSEKGTGGGLFFGSASEGGKNTAVPVEQQLNQFVGQWIKGLSGQVDPSLINDVLSAGSADEMVKRAAMLAGVPAFASGGYHTGGLMLVGEQGPELVNTGPSRVLSNSDTVSALKGNSDTILKQVLAELSQIRKYMATSVNIIDQWDGEGMPAVRT